MATNICLPKIRLDAVPEDQVHHFQSRVQGVTHYTMNDVNNVTDNIFFNQSTSTWRFLKVDNNNSPFLIWFYFTEDGDFFNGHDYQTLVSNIHITLMPRTEVSKSTWKSTIIEAAIPITFCLDFWVSVCNFVARFESSSPNDVQKTSVPYNQNEQRPPRLLSYSMVMDKIQSLWKENAKVYSIQDDLLQWIQINTER